MAVGKGNLGCHFKKGSFYGTVQKIEILKFFSKESPNRTAKGLGKPTDPYCIIAILGKGNTEIES